MKLPFIHVSDQKRTLYLSIPVLALNFLLAYGPISLEAELWLFLALLLLLAAALGNARPQRPTGTPAHEETLPPIPGWAWVLIALAGLSLRLYQFERFQWPVPDEGRLGYFSMELSRKWDWHFFFAAQHPGLFNWFLGLFFKFFTPSLFSLRLFPALASLATLAVGYRQIRNYFSGSFGLVYFFLLSSSFWPLFIASYCHPYVIGFFWEILTLVLFTSFLTAARHRQPLTALALGFILGAGFFAAIPWLLLAAPLALAVLMTCLSHGPQRRWKSFFCFLLSFIPVLSLFTAVFLHEKNTEHIRALFSSWNGNGFWRHLADWGDNVSSLFWGAANPYLYSPAWGGMFNPILDTLFFWGIVESWRCRKSPVIRWVYLTLACCFVPALISGGVEDYRIFLTVPFLFFIVGLGFQSLARSLSPRAKAAAVGLILIASGSLDLQHFRKYPAPGPVFDQAENAFDLQTYDVLRNMNEKTGPGAFLADIGPNLQNQTLSLALYPFNAALNPGRSFADCRWISVIVNEAYRPFLTARFPDAAWFTLGADPYWHEGKNLLAVIPIHPSNRLVLENWLEADRLLQPLTLKIYYAKASASQKPFMDEFLNVLGRVKSDPFLASALVERMLFYKRMDGSAPTPLELIQLGLQYGYPLSRFDQAAKGLQAGRAEVIH